MAGDVRLRAMTEADVPEVVAIQEPGAVAGLAEVFPQDAYPFPRADIAQRWLDEIAAPGIDCYVVTLGENTVGFAAIRGAELLHFGIRLEDWGSGIARRAHDALLDALRAREVQRCWLTVFTQNGRGRRCYEKLGWRPTGAGTRSSYPPHPELLRYELDLGSG